MREVLKYSGCFVCGEKNEIGLQAKFHFDGEKAITKVKAGTLYEGYAGIYHGGILSTLLDEVMIKAILANERFAVTAEMTIRFVAPVRTGDELTITGWVTKSKGRIFVTEGKAVGKDGTVYATATGKYIEAKEELRQELVKSVE